MTINCCTKCFNRLDEYIIIHNDLSTTEHWCLACVMAQGLDINAKRNRKLFKEVTGKETTEATMEEWNEFRDKYLE